MHRHFICFMHIYLSNFGVFIFLWLVKVYMYVDRETIYLILIYILFCKYIIIKALWTKPMMRCFILLSLNIHVGHIFMPKSNRNMNSDLTLIPPWKIFNE